MLRIEKLKSHIQTAIYDPRDVMLWSEYENRGQGQITKINKTFKEYETNVL